MGFFDQLLQLPYAYVVLPCLVFLAIAGGCYWILRPVQQVAPESAETPDGMQAFATTEAPKNQRAVTRRHGNPVQVLVAAPEAKKSPSTGSVLDRSMGGMRLALYEEIMVGTVLAVRPTEADDMVPWVDIEVRSCKLSKDMPGQFEVGCQYVKSPPYSIQLLFG